MDKHKTPEAQRAAHQKLRREVLYLLGNRCVRCGFEDQRALQIDHIKGGGTAEQRDIGSTQLLRRVRAAWNSGDRGTYQLLCANCNWIKRHEHGETNVLRSTL